MVVNIALLSKCRPFLPFLQVLNNKIGFLTIFFDRLLFNISLGLMDRNSEISHRFSLGFVYLSLENTLCSFRHHHHQLENFRTLKIRLKCKQRIFGKGNKKKADELAMVQKTKFTRAQLT